MKIFIADNAGFCFGVRRAFNITEKELQKKSGNIYSLGQLVHNQDVVKSFGNKGLKPINALNETDGGKVIVRSHGIPKSKEAEIRNANLDLVDCTCPDVKSVHKKVAKYHEEGYNIIIIGDSIHPEVVGINGWCDNKAFIVNTIEDADQLPNMDKMCIVSQTTNTQEKFDTLSNVIKTKGQDVQIFNTICQATTDRQNSAKEIAKKVDAMIVIGGHNSSNTSKLYEISKKYCQTVYHIERITELSLQELSKFNTIGITAGASTPDWIIKEAIEEMSNHNNNNEMIEAIENSFVRIQRNDIVKGEVIFVTDEEVMVNINYKSDGIIEQNELAKDPDLKPKDLYKEGDEIEVYVINIDDGEGNVVLSTKRVEEFKKWEELEESFETEEILEAEILRVVKGGLIAIVEGVNGFMPASHISVNYVSNLDKFKDKTLRVRILDIDKQKRRMILSRKIVEQEELEEKREKLWESLEIDETIEGVVRRLTDFGAFVDLGGVDGLIHISDLSWHRVKHPSEVVSPNDKVEVKVLDFDKDKNRISLGLKQTIEEPWTVFKDNAEIGDIVEGTVVNLLDFGAFIRLEEGVDGLLHVSQISQDHVNQPSDVLNTGDKVSVKIIDIDEDEKRISLSMKAIEEDKEETKKENLQNDNNFETGANETEEDESDNDITIQDMIEDN